MLQSRGRTLVLYPAVALIATFLAACDSTVGPDLAGRRETQMCETNSYDEPVCYPIDPVLEARLVFSGMDEFEANLGPLQDASKEELIAVEQSRIGQFESLRAYLDADEDTEEAAAANAGTDGPTGNEGRAWENDGVTREDFPVSDAFLSVLNNRGEVQIGGSVFKVTRDHVYEVAVDYASVLNEKVPTLSSPPPADGDPAIAVHAVESTLPRESGEVLTSTAPEGGALFNHVAGVGGHCYVNGSDGRMHGKSYVSNFFFYAEAGVTTEWERKKKFLWWTTWSNTWQSGTLAHGFNGDLYVGTWFGPWSPVGPGNGSQSQTGTSRIHRTLAWAVGIGMRVRGNVHAHHTVANGSANGSCDTAASA
jgi:hypothetical protein